MALPPAAYAPHARVQFGGRLGGRGTTQEDIWVCSVAVQIGGPGFSADPQALADQIAPKLSDWFGSGANGMSNRSLLDFVKVNNILPNGKYKDAVTHQHNFVPPVVGASVQQAPAFCSVAYTWETGFLRGKAHRGRIYPPNFTYAADGSHITSAALDSALASAHDLIATVLAGFEPTGGLLYQPAVASRTGELKYVTSVSVDDIYDVQRRRKNKLVGIRRNADTPG